MTMQTVQVPRANPRPPGAEDIVARRVAYERERRGWSTAELARRMTEAGVPLNQSSIYKIEKGTPRRTISLDEALAFARVFGRSLDELRSMPDDQAVKELAQIERAIERTLEDAQDRAENLISLDKDLLKRWRALRRAGYGSAQVAERVIASMSAVVKMLTEVREAAADILAEARTVGEQTEDTSS
jgi:transcriptional regulator with XRE-family HTH domain